MYINLQNINVKDRKKLEASLRSLKNASNFSVSVKSNPIKSITIMLQKP